MIDKLKNIFKRVHVKFEKKVEIGSEEKIKFVWLDFRGRSENECANEHRILHKLSRL